ncbi:hypothetical protein VPFG_00174 [Vibrio phage nt-1]|uniref:Uncharacterized protein n=1 Tax=Vibrio phage nt-1 TaxID=115992 RepID=R9TEJ3_9CAUD|nr:hypothetical protein VPFG_00174 [Vibrio phage nt-1]AGN30176.1 hypothetical protein VPFG_00174 [Vibrio phage nt-1]
MIEVNIDDLLKNGKVTFEFEKADGSVKTVTGTRNLDFIPAEFHPKDKPLAEGEAPKEKTEKQKATCGYFDLEANGWRSFKRANLREVKSFV